MPFDFLGKRVLVAGGSRGIGRAIALGFATAGADVSICARSAPALQATHDELTQRGHRVHAAVCDLADGPAVTRYVDAAAAALGGIDVLVNNASGFGMGDDEAGWAAGWPAMRSTTARWLAYRLAAWARPTKSPRSRCSWPRPTPAGSPARSSPSMAASCWVSEPMTSCHDPFKH